MTDADLLSLHRSLVEIPSISGAEAEVMDFAFRWLQSAGLETWRVGRNVLAKTPGEVKLLLNTHLDTVPSSASWTREPHTVTTEEGRIYGLGSNDAKGCAAAMMIAMARHRETPGLALLLAVDEETGGQGTEIAWPHLRDELGWTVEAVLVGEPTELQAGIGQWGMLILELVAEGTPCHAAHAATLGHKNPIFALSRDLAKLETLALPTGGNFACPTVLTGSQAKNQVPGEAKAILDIRTLPGQSHPEIEEFLAQILESSVRVVSNRLNPYQCDPHCRLMGSVRKAIPSTPCFESRTMSDQVFFQGVNAVKLGPGVSARSHTADEYILESELVEGAAAYQSIIKEFLA